MVTYEKKKRTLYVQRAMTGVGGGPFEDGKIDILFPNGAKIVFMQLAVYGIPMPATAERNEIFLEASRVAKGLLNTATGEAPESYGSVFGMLNIMTFFNSSYAQDKEFDFSNEPIIFAQDTHLYVNAYKNYTEVQGHCALIIHYFEEK